MVTTSMISAKDLQGIVAADAFQKASAAGAKELDQGLDKMFDQINAQAESAKKDIEAGIASAKKLDGVSDRILEQIEIGEKLNQKKKKKWMDKKAAIAEESKLEAQARSGVKPDIGYGQGAPGFLTDTTVTGSESRGYTIGRFIGALTGVFVPTGTQGINPPRDSAITGTIFGLLAGVFEALYQSGLYLFHTPPGSNLWSWTHRFWNRAWHAAGMGAGMGAWTSTIFGMLKQAAYTGSGFRTLWGDECMEQWVQENFSLDEYMSAPWYPQFQNELFFQRAEQMSCMSTIYTKKYNHQWTININQTGGYSEGDHSKTTSTGGSLCASQQKGAKLVMGYCNLLPAMGGPYWVIKYTEQLNLAHAVVIGGQPNKADGNGKCGYVDRLHNGMWVFTRKRSLNVHEEIELSKVIHWMRDERRLDIRFLLRTPQNQCE